MWENTPISHAEKLQINDIGNLFLREMEWNFLFLKFELLIVTSFQKEKKKKKNNNMEGEEKSNLRVE